MTSNRRVRQCHAVQSERYRFGAFDFDAQTLELRRDGSTVHLQAQPARLLACLVRNSDRIVTREELHTAIWGSETFVDFERGLNFCISQLRSALADDAARPVYIRTFARQGYRFVAPLERPADASRDGWFRMAGAGWWRQPRSVLALVLVAIAATIAMAFAGRGWWQGRTADQPPIVAVLRFDNETGNPEITRFSDRLTDTFVERLTSLSQDRYAVIGNARILRLPREERDLNIISRELRANYIVLGQVQARDDKTRILVHLIHMPEQTHVAVGGIERAVRDLSSLETEASQKIATDFSQRVRGGETRAMPQPPGSR